MNCWRMIRFEANRMLFAREYCYFFGDSDSSLEELAKKIANTFLVKKIILDFCGMICAWILYYKFFMIFWPDVIMTNANEPAMVLSILVFLAVYICGISIHTNYEVATHKHLGNEQIFAVCLLEGSLVIFGAILSASNCKIFYTYLSFLLIIFLCTRKQIIRIILKQKFSDTK